MIEKLFDQAPLPLDRLYAPVGNFLDVLAVGVSGGQRRIVDAAIQDDSLSVEYVECAEDQIAAAQSKIAELLTGRAPRRVLCFGGHATRAVTGDGFNAQRCRGAWRLDGADTPIFFFPYAGVCRENRIIREWMYEDVGRALAMYPEFVLSLFGYQIVETAEQARAALEGADGLPYVIDIETFRPQHQPGHEILCIAWCKVGDRVIHVWDCEKCPEALELLKDFLRRNPELVCFQNGSYECSSVEQCWDIRLGPACYLDTYIAGRLRQGDGDSGLDHLGGLVGAPYYDHAMAEELDLAADVLAKLRTARDKPVVLATEKVTKIGTTGKKYSRTVPTLTRPPTEDEKRKTIVDEWCRERTFRKEKTSFEKIYGQINERWVEAALSDHRDKCYIYGLVPREKLLRYNAQDVAVTSELVPILEPFAKSGPTRHVWEDSLQWASSTVARMEQAGLLVDLPKMKALEAQLDAEMAEKRAAIECYLPGVNIDSDDELAKGLYETLKLPVTLRTEKGKKPSVSKFALAKIRDKHPVVPFVQEYATLKKLQSSYARGLLKHIGPDGRIHARFDIVGAESGRMSCKRPNLQTIPSRGELSTIVKSMYIAPPGKKLVEIDFGQLELRVLAMVTQDPVLLDLLNRGVDVHMDCAIACSQMIWGSSWDEIDDKERKHRRKAIKEIVFGCVSMDTQILTKEGWKTYDQVRPGDYTVGRSGKWVRVLEKVKYDAAPVVEWRGFRVTTNHRWWSDYAKHVGKNKYEYVGEFTTLGGCRRSSRIKLSVPYTDGEGCGLTPDECALLGWIVTDGHIPPNRNLGCVHLYQSETANPDKVEEIRALLNRLPVEFSEYTNSSWPGRLQWRIKDPEKVWRHRCEQLSEAFVLRMSSAERAAFVRAGLLAEGHKQHRWAFTQKPGRVADAFRLAFHLDGNFVTQTRNRGAGDYKDHWCWRMNLGKGHVTGQRLGSRREWPVVAEEPVWCVRTEDETWTMRRGDTMALTGNTVYLQSTKGLAERANITEDKAAKVQNYIIGRFKVMSQVARKLVLEASKTGEIWTWWNGTDGRRRPISDIGSSDNGAKGHGERQANNTRIQGGGHEFCLASAGKITRWIDRDEVGARLILAVHDALYAEVEEDYLEEYIRGACKIMLSWNSVGVPMIVEVKVGNSLGEMETYDHHPLLAA